MKKVYLIIIFALFFFSSCFNPKIEITREYVTSSNWGKSDNSKDRANVSIKKININDTTINPLNRAFEIEDVVNNYTVDSSFCFRLYYTENWKINKIFFDREQKDVTWTKECTSDLLQKTKVIGKLELNTWYKIGSVKYSSVFLVFVDNQGKTHLYEFSTAKNW